MPACPYTCRWIEVGSEVVGRSASGQQGGMRYDVAVTMKTRDENGTKGALAIIFEVKKDMEGMTLPKPQHRRQAEMVLIRAGAPGQW